MGLLKFLLLWMQALLMQSRGKSDLVREWERAITLVPSNSLRKEERTLPALLPHPCLSFRLRH
jgi:hypothetical protein